MPDVPQKSHTDEVDIRSLADSKGYELLIHQETVKSNNHARQREWALMIFLAVILIFAMCVVAFGDRESKLWGLQFIAMIGSGVGGSILGQKIANKPGDKL